jgi:maltose alpha-D-glucosyltransferase/alpha-amylase
MAASPLFREGLTPEPFWYKSGVFYEVHVRAFHDADGDGSGDFRGLTEKLDYIRDLGVTAIWLLPFYPSPHKDDGYDIADYCNVHPMFGTLADFKAFLRKAHRCGLRVITELVLNHTSDQHPWFQRARLAKPGSRWRNFYVWSDTPEKYLGTRIIFKDVELSNWTWDHAAGAYYWHRFFSHQPDLNFDNPEVHEKLIKVVDFWLDMGVDGLRLDAVPYLYEREGTNCENLPETHAFLKKLRAYVDKKYSDRMLLAEANQWPEDSVAYFGQGKGDECHMAFHFPLMPRLFMALRMEDRFPVVEILEQTPPIPESCQWALFLRNHDELSLEMVTDEERDYMYRMFAPIGRARLNLGIRRRLAPLLNNDRKSIELLNALLLSLPGTPVLYYGDEIGLGDNIYLADRNGVRTPMQWSSDKNAGFSRANPQSLYLPPIVDPSYHYEANNVEGQLANPHSLLWWMRRLLTLRKRWRALGEGKCEFLHPDNHKILSYILRHEEETILVAANLSRFPQSAHLDLSAFKQKVPVELFGRTKFPVITDAPYLLTFGPHNFYWFSIEPMPQFQSAQSEHGTSVPLPTLALAKDWWEIFSGKTRLKFEALLPDYLESRPWLSDKAAAIKLAFIREFFRVPLPDGNQAALAFIQVEHVDAGPQLFMLPLAFDAGDKARQSHQDGVAELTLGEDSRKGVLYDAFTDTAFTKALLDIVRHHEHLRNDQGMVQATHIPALRHVLNSGDIPDPTMQITAHGNVIAFFGDRVALKFFRQPAVGINPDLEIGQFLTTRNFAHSAPLLGALEYKGAGNLQLTLAVAKTFVPHSQNARDFTLDAIGHYYDQVAVSAAQAPASTSTAAQTVESIGTYLESARLLGGRTAELHLALSSDLPGGEFSKEPITRHSLRGVFESMRSLALRNLRLLRKQLSTLPQDLAPVAQRVMGLEPAILRVYQRLFEEDITAKRIRIHGDCHLGNLLWTGHDFVFLDFEGDATKPVSERRIKHSPLRDVARMLRSFHHSAYTALHQLMERGVVSQQNLSQFEPWVRHWNQAVSRSFLQAYFGTLGQSAILPGNEEQLRPLLRAYLLNQVVDELGRELNLRSDGVRASLQAIIYLTEEQLQLQPPQSPQAPDMQAPPK